MHISQPRCIRPLKLGTLSLDNNILFAPLAGVSDLPFRHMCRKRASGLMFCEMVKMDGLVRLDSASFRMLHYSASMHPIGAQLCGTHPRYAAAAAKMVEELGFDVVDLNCGCPVDKVIDDGSGSGLLKTPWLIGDILANMVASVSIPVTVKVRAGWDDQHIIVRDLVRIAELAGAKAITVHGRTRKQGYSGEVNLEWIRAAKQEARSIAVIGNGDIFSAPAALRMFAETGCDGVMIARGACGQPWLAEDIIALDRGDPVPSRSPAECLNTLLEHFEATLSSETDHGTLVAMRRVGCAYINRFREARHMREELCQTKTIAEVRSLIENALIRVCSL